MDIFFSTPDRKAQTFLVLSFAFSRLVFYGLGLKTRHHHALHNVANRDPVWLRRELFETLFYLHGQPPLFNFLIGVVAKLPEGAWAPVWSALFMGFGLALCLAIYNLCRALNSRPPLRLQRLYCSPSALKQFYLKIGCSTLIRRPLLLTLGVYFAIRYLRPAPLASYGQLSFFYGGVPTTLDVSPGVAYRPFGFIWWATIVANYSRRRAAAALLTGIALVTSVYAKTSFFMVHSAPVRGSA